MAKRTNVRPPTSGPHFPSDESAESAESVESDEAPGSDGEAARPSFSPIRKRKSAAGGVFALSILTGWSSIEKTTILGCYGSWAEVQAKAKEILDKGYGYASFWCTEENGGYREENIEMGEKFEDNTDAPEPSDEEPTELAAAEHCEGGKGQMMMFAQRLPGVALA